MSEATPAARRPPAAALAAGAAALAAAVAVGPLLAHKVGQLWESPRYGHAPLVWAAAAALGWWRLREARERAAADGLTFRTAPRPATEAALWAVALLTAAGAVWLRTPWLALVAAFCGVPAAAYSAGGLAVLRPILPAFAVLWTTLPPPFHLDSTLVLKLQRVAADLASAGLDLLGRRHLLAGVTVQLPERSYFVEEACSGVNSLYALFGVAALALAWGRRGWPRWLVVLPAAIVWAVAANAVRVTLAVELSAGLGWPVVEGFGHELLGVLTFALAGLLTLSTDALLLFAVPPREEGEADEPGRLRRWFGLEPTDAALAEPDRRGLPPIPRAAAWGTAAAVLAGLAGWRLADDAAVRTVAVPTVPGRTTLKPLAENSLPAEWDGWRRVGFETVTRDRGALEGPFSAVWTYARGPLTAAISLDGPFAEGWHDLRVCYTQGGGWACTDAVDRVVEPAGDAGVPDDAGPGGDVITRLELEQPLGRRGLVLFTSYALDDDANLGADIVTRSRDMFTWRFDALRELVAAPEGRTAPEPAYQVQIYTAAYRPFGKKEREALAALFHEMRGRLAALPREGAPREQPPADPSPEDPPPADPPA